MFLRWTICIYFAALIIGCRKQPSPTGHPTPIPLPKPIATLQPSPTPFLALPSTPRLTKAGEDLIIEFEVGGPSEYDPKPEWPQGASGVTIGVGYDLGYNSRTNILSDWVALGNSATLRFANLSGITGTRARDRLSTVRDILVKWQIALGVFNEVDVARTYGLCQRTFSRFEELRPNAQASLISLIFNRGNGMSGPNRTEMRAIRDVAPNKDYAEMASQLRKMKRIWVGTSIYKGMARRREAEAVLMETPR